MCGIVGYLTGMKNGFTMKETAMLNDMLYMDALRGWDATGIMYGVKSGSVQVYKAAQPSPLFLATKEWDSASSEITSQGRWAFGHNRAATRGSKSDENAHPFVVDNKIILLQNGTYNGSHHQLTTQHYEVDSHACAKVIADSATVEEALNKIDAAYAFVWWNHEEETLNIIRNSERPLYIGYTKSGGIAFSSEPGIMIAAANRNSIEFKSEPYMLAEHQLCTYKFGHEIEETYAKLDIKPKVQRFFPQQTPVGQAWRSSTATNVPDNRRVLTVIEGWRSVDPQNLYQQGGLDQDQFNVQLSRVQKAAKEKTVLTVEAMEYTPTKPTDYNCNQWYVFGQVNEVNESGLADLIVSWTIEAKTAHEVVEYITNNMFQVTLMHLNGRKDSTGKYIVVASAATVTELQIIQNETVH